MKVTVLAACSIALLAGCGASGSAATSGTPSAASIATKIGCTGETPEPSPQLFVADQATCTLNGVTVIVYTFAKTADADSWWKIASTFGVANDVRSGNVIVDATNQATSAKVKAALGGS